MNLDNQTPFYAKILKSEIPTGDATLVMLIVKACGVIDPQDGCYFNPEIEVPYIPEDEPLPYGVIPGDLAIQKDGADVMALGYAYSPDGRGSLSSDVVLKVKESFKSLRVHGDRSWIKRGWGSGLSISDTIPFSRIPMSWDYSYGGKVLDEYGENVLHPINARGRGYYLDEDDAEDQLLANIENPAAPVRTFQDQPEPFNISPLPIDMKFGILDIASSLQEALDKKETWKLPPSLWNRSHPSFRFDALQPNDAIMLSGMSEQPLKFQIPNAKLFADAHVGNREKTLPLKLDTLMITPEDSLCYFTWRLTLRYDLVAREKRSLCLRMDAEGDVF